MALSVIVPYTTIAPGVEDALVATGRPWNAVDVSGSDKDYWTVLDRLWGAGDGFILVEHDVIVRHDTFDLLSECPHPWCAYELPYVGMTYAGLGCVKFAADIIRLVPNALNEIGRMSCAGHPAKHWCKLDHWLQSILGRTGVARHLHGPPLAHYRADGAAPWPTHGCVPH